MGMKWMALTVTVESDAATAELAQDLIAGSFYDLGLSGLVISDPVEMTDDRQRGGVTGYIYKDASADRKREQLTQAVDRLARTHEFTCRVSTQELDDEDWATSWKDHFYTQKVGAAIVVKPTWRDYTPAAQEVVIELDPGMAFGTGAHPTTSMCVKMIEQHIAAGDNFLDIGAGSGLLMIVAAKMGADRVWGTDDDPVAIQVARENLLLNQISPDKFSLLQADLVAGINGRFNCIVANILTEVIVQLAPDIPRLLAPGGCFICTGIIDAKKHLVEAALAEQGLEIKKTHKEEEWVCLVAE